VRRADAGEGLASGRGCDLRFLGTGEGDGVWGLGYRVTDREMVVLRLVGVARCMFVGMICVFDKSRLL
jgi:hypothetical protein